MKNVHRWTATRSGPAITITGDGDDGALVKITGVKAISADALWPIAVDDAGQHWRLLPSNYDQIRSAIAATVSAGELMGFMGEDEDAEACIACNAAFKDDDEVYSDLNGGYVHAACIGTEQEGFVDGNGDPLGPNDPIPKPVRWGNLPAAALAEA